jgi:2-pyrone-4,6-dicarboxylate lactonase
MAIQEEPRMPTPPRLDVPPGACDAHTHVFPPLDEFPLQGSPSYLPPLAPVELHLEMLDRAKMTRGVVVQPAVYGNDVSALAHAIRRSNGRLRGIGTATRDISDEALDAMREAGICGLRFTEARLPSGERYRGSVPAAELQQLAERMKARGMHAQVWPAADGLCELLDDLLPLGLPIVLEHMGGFDIQRGTADRTFQELLALLRDGRIWIKLVVCRRSTAAPRYEDLRPFHDALVEANPSRLVWGSDWPFVRMGERAPDVGHLLDLFGEWVADASLRQKILVDNPQELYEF